MVTKGLVPGAKRKVQYLPDTREKSDGVDKAHLKFQARMCLYKLSELLSGCLVELSVAARGKVAALPAGQRRCVGKGLKPTVLAAACGIPFLNSTHHAVRDYNWAKWDEAAEIVGAAFHAELEHCAQSNDHLILCTSSLICHSDSITVAVHDCLDAWHPCLRTLSLTVSDHHHAGI
jgi:hypothetical protein